jgi:low temperature requirement protein LtrA
MSWVRPMLGRSPTEPHRAATPLELLFDLVFVVAVAFASSAFHHQIADDQVRDGIVSYALVFFAIWWPWINFTWFASAYDTDDAPYRLLVLVQMTGALIVAAGVPRLFDDLDMTVVLIGYVVMRLAGVTQWIRVARSDQARRSTSLRFAFGIGVVQIAWVLLLFAPEPMVMPGFTMLVIAELLVPIWAERANSTPWHRGHISERYGLFTIIVLGESILAASIAIQTAAGVGDIGGLGGAIAGGLLIVYSMWWLYFDRPNDAMLTSLRRAFLWGYGHYFIWAAAAAVGAGLAVVIDQARGLAVIGSAGAGASVAIPAAVFVLGIWLLLELPDDQSRRQRMESPAAAALILATPLTGHAVLLTGIVLAALVALKAAGPIPARGT